MKAKPTILMLAVVLFGTALTAQDVSFIYSYDASGNRVKRAFTLEEVEGFSSILEPLMLEVQAEQEEQQPQDSLAVDAFKVQIYPNPSNGYYTVELPELKDGERGYIQVYSMRGQVMQEHRAVHRIQSVNITGAFPGYYFIRVVIGDKLVQKTLIKQ